VAVDVSKVALVHPTDAARTTRVGHIVKKDGTKTRVARQAANKEIK
jgi:ribosomal protein L24